MGPRKRRLLVAFDGALTKGWGGNVRAVTVKGRLLDVAISWRH